MKANQLLLSALFSLFLVQTSSLAEHVGKSRHTADLSYRAFLVKLQRLKCKSRYKSNFRALINDPDSQSTPKLAKENRTAVKGGHQILDNLERLRKDGNLPLNVGIYLKRKNFNPDNRGAALKGNRIDFYADKPPTLEVIKATFASIGDDFPRGEKLTDTEWEFKQLKCKALLSVGAYGGISADGNISMDDQTKILNVIISMGKKGYRLHSPQRFITISNSVREKPDNTTYSETLIIHPHHTEAVLHPFFAK